MPRLTANKLYILLAVGAIYMFLMFYIQSNFSPFKSNQNDDGGDPAGGYNAHINRGMELLKKDHRIWHHHSDKLHENEPDNPSKNKHDAANNAAPAVQPDKPKAHQPLNLDNVTFTSQCDGNKYTDSYFKQLTPSCYVYSAYLDDRKTPQGLPAFARFMIYRDQSQPKLYCHFLKPDNTYHTVASQDLKDNKFGYYELCENHGMNYGGYVSSCRLPSLAELGFPANKANKWPCSVYLSATDQTSPSDIRGAAHLPLRSVNDPSKQFGMCVPALFGHVKPDHLIEFFEVSRALGAQHMHMYHWESSPSTRRVLQHYSDVGFLTVVPWKIPQQDSNNWNFAQILNVNECLFRSMSVSRYVTFNDIDEYIVPRFETGATESVNAQSAWEQLQKRLWTPDDKTCGVCFPMVYFDLNREPSYKHRANDGGQRFEVQQYLERSRVVSRVRTKCLVESRRIFEMGIHHISKPNEEFYTNFKADPGTALVNHYRACLGDYGMRCDEFDRDISGVKYTQELMHVWKDLKEKLEL